LYERDGFDLALGEAGLRGLGSFVPHPPANALWLLPLASSPPELAKALWTLALILSIGVAIAVLIARSPGLEPSVAIVLVMAPTLSVRNGLAFGQPYLILASLLLCGVLALERERMFLAGFLLGLGASFKPYALVIGPLLLRRDRRGCLAGFVFGALSPSLALLALTGAAPFLDFGSRVLPWMLRGDIQDPFSPGWGSAMALSNRLLRFEPDLNPRPWLHAPLLAHFIGASVSAALLALGVLSGRRALDSGRPLDAVGIVAACALGASPFVASYHLVLLVVSALAVFTRLHGHASTLWLLGWALLGSPLINHFREASGLLAPLAYLRFFGLLGFALILAWPFLDRRTARIAGVLGISVGVFALPWGRREDIWPKIESAKGYSMMRPHFCGESLRWMAPSKDGRRLESRGEGKDCTGESARRKPVLGPLSSGGAGVTSRFTAGSWDLYLRSGSPGVVETRLTFSDANEVDPVLTPEGCAVVFASDQGRGLGSTALYRLDISGLIAGCAESGRASGQQ
jgi:hypothetical protein